MQAGKGVFVQEPTRAEVAGAFAWPFAAQVSAADTFQLRFALEGFACGLAVGVMTAEVLDILEDGDKLAFIRPERAQETWQEHRKILKALARHAAGPAQKAMQQHIRAAALRTGIAFITLGD